MINHGELEKRESLLKAATYLTKQDVYIKIALDGGGRCFVEANYQRLAQ